MTSSIETIECKSTAIQKVTVFSDRAEIRRNVSVKLEQGINEINIINLPGDILDDSVRISGTGKASIHEVQIAWKKATKGEKDCPQAAEARRNYKDAENIGDILENRRSILVRKREALNALLQKLGGTEKAQNLQFDDRSFEGISNLFRFYEAQIVELRDQEALLKEEEDIAKEKKKILKDELQKFERPSLVRTITVVLEAKKTSLANLILSYLVRNAHWKPSYDIRVETGHENYMNLTYSGRITQSSGEEWSNCELVLSTATPCYNAKIPELGTLEVIFEENKTNFVVLTRKRRWRMARSRSRDRSRSRSRSPSSSSTNSDKTMEQAVAMIEKQVLSTEFVIARPAAIPPDGAEHKVTIGAASFEPHLQRECVPSKNNNVYLIGSTRNSSPLSFLPGEATIFLDGNFVTKSQLKAISPGEHFSVSLGQDASIKVDYKPAHNKQGEAGLINKNNTTVKEQKIVVKNTRNEKVLVTIKEHVPRSTDEKIKVRLVSPSPAPLQVIDEGKERKEGALINAQTNNLEYSVEIGAQDKKEFSVKYQIDFPQGEKLEYQEKF